MQLSGLFIYPVKSLRGLSVPRATVTARGLQYDRRFMVVDDQGTFVSQRETPAMARVSTAIDGETLQLSADGGGVELPLQPRMGEACEVGVWEDRVPALAVSKQADRWLSEQLDRAVRMVFMPESTERQVDLDYASEGDVVSFADGFPYLILGEASVAELNTRLGEPIDANRFRTNLLVRDAEPYAEDGWQRIEVGPVTFELPKDCSRCTMVNTDQTSGARVKEPLATMAKYRPRPSGSPTFGQNALALGSGELSVGDPVRVLAER